MSEGPDFDKTPLIPVIVQESSSGVVLMLAYMNAQAYGETLETGRVCFFSRSRQRIWRKGEESGFVQKLRDVYFDCDVDAILVKVEQVGGAACHLGFRSCFFRRVDRETGRVAEEGQRVFDPKVVYGNR